VEDGSTESSASITERHPREFVLSAGPSLTPGMARVTGAKASVGTAIAR
jgi:hypothetical protein